MHITKNLYFKNNPFEEFALKDVRETSHIYLRLSVASHFMQIILFNTVFR